MMMYSLDREICAFCKYWMGDARMEFCPNHRIKLDQTAKGMCRERNMQMPASRTCPKFEKRADL